MSEYLCGYIFYLNPFKHLEDTLNWPLCLNHATSSYCQEWFLLLDILLPAFLTSLIIINITWRWIHYHLPPCRLRSWWRLHHPLRAEDTCIKRLEQKKGPHVSSPWLSFYLPIFCLFARGICCDWWTLIPIAHQAFVRVYIEELHSAFPSS